MTANDSIRTLIVDDDYRVGVIHAAYVNQTAGYCVVGEAHTAAEALLAISTERPDLVLMDVYLPDGNGLDVVRTMLEEKDHPDVIVITAARDVDTVRTAIQLGAVHYLVKPFGFAALNERLGAYRRLRARLSGLNVDADQADVDELFSLLRTPGAVGSRPDKGHSAPTLALVHDAVASADGDISAAEVADRTGLSRATAQRYLNYLERHGVIEMRLRYGSAGRPRHRYKLVAE
jgi:response regulator of citrate/malate metabolism